MELDRHQIGPPAGLIDGAECGKTAHRWQLSAGVHHILVGDQPIAGSGRVRSGHARPIFADKG
jgi:hypothetical protein